MTKETNIMSLKFYYDIFSQPSRAVLLLLKLNKIPFEPKKINLLKGEHYSEEYAKINPFQKVPAIVHGDFALSESVAILRYLCREFEVADHWYPKDSKAQAKVDEYVEWQHIEIRANLINFFQTKFLLPVVTGRPADGKKVATYEKKVTDVLNKLDTWLTERQYLGGDKVSIADLLGACEVEHLRMAGYNPRDNRPKVSAWLNKLKEELNPHYEDVHSLVNHIAEKHKGVPPSSPDKL